MNDNKKGLKTGLTKYNSSISKISDKKINKDDNEISKGKYPNGITPFISLLLIFGIIVLIGYLVNTRKLLQWYDIFAIASATTFGLNVLWLSIRQRFNLSLRYSMKKMIRSFKLDRLKFTEPYSDLDYSIHKVTNIEEYKEYLKERSKRSSTLFYISFGIHTITFIVFIVLSCVL
ncbi:hypothetical protein D8X55_03815 [Malacoplasma penetrans]|uniref:DUF3899 domain-containing protein n=1 Tax=Malacoplasma penetrans (strain HF-2) TaxID=272633 RepID=Q8EVL2_MALP2|nr:hypothetical protein [Malacoplasma penetrans]RXY96393.1 hypothetical protein D8X55_03815 [Malacoplasma penetrans]BAC44341.1 hypothetical protein [Malacoplasma penetrans HF-2]